MSDLSGLRSALLPKLPEPQGQSPVLSSETKAKIEKSSHDFESILLNNWMQGAYGSFGSVPGGDDDDADSGKGQFQSIGIQALSAAMTARGGIGISKMITEQLTKSAEAQESKSHPAAPGESGNNK